MLSVRSLSFNEKQFSATKNGTFFDSIHFYQPELHDLASFQLGIIGLSAKELTNFRNQFYKLGDHFQFPLLDLGVLAFKNSEDLAQKLEEITKSIPLIIIGGARYLSNSRNAIVDHKIDQNVHTTHSHLAYQRHRSSLSHFIELNEYDNLSLGEIRKNMLMVEPLVRKCAGSNFNLSAIKKADSCIDGIMNTCGLTLEEACQIARYVGISPNTRFLQFQDLENLAKGDSESVYECASVISWYFLEGMLNRIYEKPDRQNNVSYIINNDLFEDPVTFIRSNLSGRWWIKVGDDDSEAQPCLYEDYISCRAGNIPDRLLNMLSQ